MFCTGCGRPAGPADQYCAGCGRPLAVQAPSPAGDPPSAAAPPVDGRLRLLSGALALAAAAFNIAALFPTYSYAGADAARMTLHDAPSNLAYNLVFIGTLLVAAVLALVGRTARFGLGMVTGSGFLFLALFIADVGDVVRGGDAGTSAYLAPGLGFYLGASLAAVGVAAACVAMIALRRYRDLMLVRVRTTGLWAVAGLVLAGAWILGEWWPWSRNVLTYTSNGVPQTYDFNACCSLSHLPGQWVAQALAFTIVLAAIGIIASTVRSSALSAGLYLSAAAYAAAPCVAVLLDKPYTLQQVANTFHWSASTLADADAAVRVEVLPGAWIAAAAAAGFLMMAAARAVQVTAENRGR